RVAVAAVGVLPVRIRGTCEAQDEADDASAHECREPRAPHHFCTVIATGTENVAPWHPLDDALLMLAAPARCTSVVPEAPIVTLRFVWFVNVTPVVVHAECPASAVIAPLPVTVRRVTEYEFGLFTRRITSADEHGSSTDVGASPPTTAVTVTGSSVPAVAVPDPCALRRQ